MRMPSVMSHDFSLAPQTNIRRSSFNRSHGYKTTFNAGYLVPFYLEEVLPGDTHNVSATLFARMATPIAPVMDNLFLETQYYFVPMRLIWENWERMCGAQDKPTDSTDFLTPILTNVSTNDFLNGTLADYFGLPTAIPAGGMPNICSLPFRAYIKIWNDWFRDENLQDSLELPLGDGPDTYNPDPVTGVIGRLLKRGKRYDYFTSSLPFAQKGPAVTLPLGTSAPVVTNGIAPVFNGPSISNQPLLVNVATTTPPVHIGGTSSGTGDLIFGNQSGLTADLSSATAATINQLRQAFQIQTIYERDARGGTRYVEVILSHFKTVIPDFRAQRAEYLGGGSQRINVTPVPQTAPTSDISPQGNLAAFGTATAKNQGFVKSFVEYGYIIGLMCVRADLTYQQGLDRMWSRRSRFDFYWPDLAHIGEQAILNKEIYVSNDGDNEDVFGYQERYAEYRYKRSMITGQFRSNFAQSLDFWHLSQEFMTRPLLNAAFIEENPPMTRVKAVENYPDFILDAYIAVNSVRPMPVYGVPFSMSRM